MKGRFSWPFDSCSIYSAYMRRTEYFENGWEIWGIGMWIGGWMERISSILRWLGDYGPDYRLWSGLHPRTKTLPVHPPPPDRSIEASVGIQCSLFIVNTTAANNTLRHFTLIRGMCILPRQMEESWIVLVSRWLTHLSAKCGKTLYGCLRACTSA